MCINGGRYEITVRKTALEVVGKFAVKMPSEFSFVDERNTVIGELLKTFFSQRLKT